jgi:quinoprotein glucose dehydrogenase
VHHDLWDYDNASPPALATVRGQPAVIQATKSGMLFVLNRVTGAPIIAVEEKPVPKTDIPGEESWPTQPFSAIRLTPPDSSMGAGDSLVRPVWGSNRADDEWCRAQMVSLRWDGIFTPPSTRGTLVRPSNIGGAHWGGVATDETRTLVVVPVNNIAAMVQLLPYASLNRDSVRRDDASRGISDFEYTRMRGTPYVMRRRLLRGPSGLPCTPPPFGTLMGVDLKAGRVAWNVPLGSMLPPDAAAVGDLGSANLGGPIATASGLVFIGATLDRGFRAFDIQTGKELWRAQLPAGARATPMTYEAGGRQFVVIAAGGGGPFGAGDSIIAFALPPSR